MRFRLPRVKLIAKSSGRCVASSATRCALRPNEIKRGRGRAAQSSRRSNGIRREATGEAWIPNCLLGHAGDGNIHVNIMADQYIATRCARKGRPRARDLFEQGAGVGRCDHRRTRNRSGKKTLVAEAASEEARDLHRRLKHALDPDNILNPGKFLEDQNPADVTSALLILSH